jgi:hypothetical protein
MTGKTAPQIHPVQRLTTPEGAEADIDTEIVPLMRALWAAGFVTTASCQDFGEGTAGQRAANPRTSRRGGDAFIAYYTGWAWLKMPVPGALRLANVLLGTGFRDKVARRWEPGAWRMHVPLISGEDGVIGPACTAQIHFPREQVLDLTRTIRRMSTES